MEYYMEDYNCFCVICGFILGIKANEGQPGIQDWWEAVLFRARPTHVCGPGTCSQRHNGDGRTIELLHASFTDGGPNAFYDPTVNGPFDRKYYTMNNIWQDDGHPWIAVHPKCLEIATRVVDFRNAKAGNVIDSDADDVSATNLGGLYEIYRARCDAQSRCPDHRFLPSYPPFVIVWEPHMYFGFGYSIWGPSYYWQEGDPELSQFEACPFPLAGITEEILSYLIQLPSQEQESPDSIPTPAILNEIIAQYFPLENPALNPQRTISPSTWREMLFSGRVLPWLWDLDSTFLKAQPLSKEKAYDANSVWDWELLVRQLAQVDIFSDGKLMANIQLGLRNRRRIWRLVDVARMSDWAPPPRVDRLFRLGQPAFS